MLVAKKINEMVVDRMFATIFYCGSDIILYTFAVY